MTINVNSLTSSELSPSSIQITIHKHLDLSGFGKVKQSQTSVQQLKWKRSKRHVFRVNEYQIFVAYLCNRVHMQQQTFLEISEK